MAIRRYRFDIAVVGPVHIGNGMRYGKKDYFASGNKIAVLDTRKFVSLLDAHQVKRYCDFLEEDRSSFGLQGFLKDNSDLSKVAERSIAYRIDSPLATARRGAIQYHDVWEFVKDPYGNPYIPGSSIKGMLRTAILLNVLLEDDSFRSLFDAAAACGRNTARKADKSIVKRAFFRERPDKADPDTVNDIMKYVAVSDSEPLSTDDLVFAKKYDLFSKDDPVDHKLDMGKLTLLKGNELDVYRECLRPGTTVSVDITVDDRVDSYFDDHTLDAQGLTTMLQRSFDFYSECFLSHFEQEGEAASLTGSSAALDGRCRYIIQSGPLKGERCRNRAVNETGYCNSHQGEAAKQQASDSVVCYLGGGVDFMNKTVVGALFDAEDERLEAISRILYSQFPTKIDRLKHPDLFGEVRRAGFDPSDMKSQYKRGRLSKAKDDHRHWRDSQLGVSPHTMKWGIVGKQKYPMGKCDMTIQEA